MVGLRQGFPGLWILVFLIGWVGGNPQAQAKRWKRYHTGGYYSSPVMRPQFPTTISLNNPLAFLRPCANGGMCRHDRPSDSNPRPIQILGDGTLAVWTESGWTVLESRLSSQLLDLYRPSFFTYDAKTRLLLAQAFKRLGQPVPVQYASINIVPSPTPAPSPKPKPLHQFTLVSYQEPTVIKPSPKPETTRLRFDLPSQWMTQRDQKDVGTCHAFALAPVVDVFENSGDSSSSLFKYRTSENWLVFVSVLDRLCSPKDQEVETGGGYWSERTLNRLLHIGYCKDGNYTDYDPKQLVYKDRDKGPDRVTFPERAAELEYFSNLFHDEKRLERFAMTEKANFDAAVERGYIPPAQEDKFKKAFGISSHFAIQKLCHVKPEDDLEKLLGGTDATVAFRRCLTEALANRKKFSERSCGVVTYDGQRSDAEKIQVIKRILEGGTPVVASVKNYGGWKDGGSHAIALTGYDDLAGKGEFHVQNSWGENRNIPIEYSKMEDVNRFTHLNCRTKQESGKTQLAWKASP